MKEAEKHSTCPVFEKPASGNEPGSVLLPPVKPERKPTGHSESESRRKLLVSTVRDCKVDVTAGNAMILALL